MNIDFYKYQGAGNDFIIIDNRNMLFPKSNSLLLAKLCNRHFGIGADGLILLENDSISDFKMVYFNADGKEGTMCGNGGRCVVSFAKELNLFSNKTTFNAIDGLHFANEENNIVSLQMMDVKEVIKKEHALFLNTGSPHHVEMVKNLSNYDVFTNGKKIRNSIYGKEGANINFVEQINDATFKIRTYERGVENETFACGTGATAVAIAMHKINKTKQNTIKIQTLGGDLQIRFEYKANQYKNVFLTGEATFVFKGNIAIS